MNVKRIIISLALSLVISTSASAQVIDGADVISGTNFNVSMKTSAEVHSSFKISLPDELDLQPEILDSGLYSGYYACTPNIGVSGIFVGKDVLEIKFPETIVLYDVSNCQELGQNAIGISNIEQSYEHLKSVNLCVEQSNTIWTQKELRLENPYVTYDALSGFYSAPIRISSNELSNGTWEGYVDVTVKYCDGSNHLLIDESGNCELCSKVDLSDLNLIEDSETEASTSSAIDIPEECLENISSNETYQEISNEDDTSNPESNIESDVTQGDTDEYDIVDYLLKQGNDT